MVTKEFVCITTNLIRKLDVPFNLEYVRASSYGQNGVKSRELTVIGLDRLDIKGKNLLVIDNIFETGNAMLEVVSQLNEKQHKGLKTLFF